MYKIKLFYSYCHQDEEFRIELEKWLTNLRNENLIDEWHDRKILAGENWKKEIDYNLSGAHIILGLLSQNFLSSQACLKEMEYAIESVGKKFIPIIIKPCTWKDAKCSSHQIIPKDAKPVSEWDTQEKAWLNIYEELKKVITEYQNSILINEDFKKELTNIEFLSENKKELTLDDIFIFPQLLGENFDSSKEESITNWNELFFNPKNTNKFYLFEGDKLSGKTTIARNIALELAKSNVYSLLLDGELIKKTINFEKYFKDQFQKQYNGNFELWKSQQNKVVIIDDFHHLISKNILPYLEQNYSKIIILMSSDEYLTYFKDDNLSDDCKLIKIKKFTLDKQEDLIRKWKTIGGNQISDKDVDLLEDKVNTIISKNQIVPRYPFYILSILQSLEAFMPNDYKITAYGHCYQALITAHLLRKNLKPDEIDTAFNYLTQLSFDIYKHKAEYTESENLSNFNRVYKERFLVADSIINKIRNNEYPILRIKENVIEFEHHYLFFFFLGKYLAETNDKELIKELCDTIYTKESAFTIIFTVHHAQNLSIIDDVILHSLLTFDKIKPAKLLKSETDFMIQLIHELPKSILSEKSTEENRKIERKIEENANEPFSDNLNESPILREFSKSLKIMEVLGQIAKNRAGSYEKKKLKEIVLSTEELGLRVLNFLLEDMQSEEYKQWLSERLDLKLEKEELSEDEKRQFIEKSIRFFAFLITVSMIDKIADYIGSDKLLPIVDEITSANMYPAYELLSLKVHLKHGDIDFKFISDLKKNYEEKKNKWAEQVLSYYLQSYLNTHNINFRLKQKILQLLNLKSIHT
ncbi:TIR domain-containing protein [Leptospira bouyouniensis]|uniref:TIR domain-containing protein n=1 Tax=Leptospira bouyouniensis TaxID=2484911 RepID=A0A7I0HPG6_9LEPT|nr:TIR domain-containing protein [Leptospira bouyouniensis]TGL04059.1 TIR domain-containing protein [Leptospira bouyouniensis]